MTQTVTLTAQQHQAVEAIMEWQRNATSGSIFNLHGYAGTGKTSVLSFLRERVFYNIDVAFCAYTGMAVNRMMSLGCKPKVTGTIHSIFKRVDIKLNEDETEEVNFRNVCPDDFLEYQNFGSESINPFQADLIVVDESSMVNNSLVDDLLSFGVPILTFGDKFQLPPVLEEQALLNKFMNKTDFLLDEVHRQALDSEIIQAATMIRKQEIDALMKWQPKKDVRLQLSDRDSFLNFKDYGQVICHTNYARYLLTRKMGFTEAKQGSPLVCIKNNRKANLFNGQIHTLQEMLTSADEKFIRFRNQDNKIFQSRVDFLNVYKQELNRNELNQVMTDLRATMNKTYNNFFDLAHVLTVHKAQGSQWPTVTIYDDNYVNSSMPREKEQTNYARWLYTACTRAQKNLNLMMSRSTIRNRYGV